MWPGTIVNAGSRENDTTFQIPEILGQKGSGAAWLKTVMMKNHGDFQRQFTSVMENLLHSAVSETTKLFENAVQEMKAELVRIRKQNDISKENLYLDECEENPCKRDIGIQCSVTVVERSCSPFQQRDKDKERILGLPSGLLQDGNQQFALVFIKQEEADLYDYTPVCLLPKLVDGQSKPFQVQQIRAAVMPREADPSPSGGTTASFTRNQTPSQPQPVQEPAAPTPVETPQSQEFNALDSLQDCLDLMPDIQEGKPLLPLQPPVPTSTCPQTDAADGSMSATSNDVTLKTEEVECEIVQQSLTSPSAAQQEQSRRSSPRRPKLKHCRVVVAETARPQAKNPPQLNEKDISTPQKKRQAVVTLTHCDAAPKASKAAGQIWLRHPGDRKVAKNQCEVCMRTLSSASALHSHRMLHTGERPYACDRCDKSFPSIRGLNRHRQVHTASRPHQCAQCGKSFVYHFNLKSHQLIHSNGKPHSCGVCGKRFLSKPELATHFRVHTNEKPYRCTVCGKRFKHRMSYNTHQRGHRGDTRYKCTICGKGFVDPSNLKTHVRIHTGEKPYKCQVCGKTFTQSGHLKKHVTTQHLQAVAV